MNKKELEEKLKATNIQRDKDNVIVKEKEAKMAAIAKEETAKAAQLEKEKEDLTQSMLEASKEKTTRRRKPPRKRMLKRP